MAFRWHHAHIPVDGWLPWVSRVTRGHQLKPGVPWLIEWRRWWLWWER